MVITSLAYRKNEDKKEKPEDHYIAIMLNHNTLVPVM